MPERSATIGRPPADNPRPTTCALRSSGPISGGIDTVVVVDVEVVLVLVVVVVVVVVDMVPVVVDVVGGVGGVVVGDTVIGSVASDTIDESGPLVVAASDAHAVAAKVTATTSSASNDGRSTRATVSGGCDGAPATRSDVRAGRPV